MRVVGALGRVLVELRSGVALAAIGVLAVELAGLGVVRSGTVARLTVYGRCVLGLACPRVVVLGAVVRVVVELVPWPGARVSSSAWPSCRPARRARWSGAWWRWCPA